MFFHHIFVTVHFLVRKVMIFDMLQVDGKMQRSGKPINYNRFSPVPEILRKRTSGAIFRIFTISMEKQHISQSRWHATFENWCSHLGKFMIFFKYWKTQDSLKIKKMIKHRQGFMCFPEQEVTVDTHGSDPKIVIF